MEPQRLSLMAANSPIGPPGTLWEPGHDANRGPRPPRDTKHGITGGDLAVLPYTISRTNTDSFVHPEISKQENERAHGVSWRSAPRMGRIPAAGWARACPAQRGPGIRRPEIVRWPGIM